ncbi:CHAT domain-containing protein [Paractinoplanes lichenicola]|uniref:CHAT domain-containing protein n=1 Tax=Paractinoplanes lichenicola TaxID=2802976 RepID=A0ABS1VZZ1_9ACTN|nr:CHAT domain-containing protein [Actinoplanes lichenicola]MBL7260060.1 CHAT domain-containing protein [Actinoplanes lichenicola]
MDADRSTQQLAAEGAAALDRGDLEVADRALRAVLDARPDHPDRADWEAGLSTAFTARADKSGLLADYDTAIFWTRAVREHDLDDDDRALVLTVLTVLLQRRCDARSRARDRPGAVADLAEAIDTCRAAVRVSDDPWTTGMLGELTITLAEDTGLAEHARTAAGLLDQAARAAADDPNAWALWHGAARANRLLAEDPAALEAAARQLDRALGYAIPDDDVRLEVHAQRVMAGQSLILHNRYDAPPGSVTLRTVVEAALEAFDAAGPGDPERRAVVALQLALGSITAGADEVAELDVARARRLLTIAAAHLPADPVWQAHMDNAEAGIAQYLLSRDPAGGGDGGMPYVASAARGNDPRQRHRVILAARNVTADTGDRRPAQAADRYTEQPLTPMAPGERISQAVPVSASDRQVIGAFSRVMGLLQDNDGAGAAAAAREVLPALEELGLTGIDLAMLMMLRTIVPLGDPLGSPVVTVPRFEPMAGAAPQLVMAAVMATASAALTQAGARNDEALFRHVVQRVEDSLERTAPADRRSFLGGAVLAAQAHLELATRWPGNLDHATRAAEWFADSMTRAGGVGFPLWPRLAMGRAEALRLTGDADPRATRELGSSALQGYAWQVFAQAGTDNSIMSARAAAADARKVASWCLADRHRDPTATEDLVAALDAGRGLVIRAATTSRSTAERLRRAGHPVLADDWERSAGLGHDLVSGLAMTAGESQGTEIPDDLRLRVLRALGGDRVAGFEPISTSEIRGALRATGTDALVYLVPGDADGYAVIVPATGDTIVLPLPRLRVGPGSPLAAYRAAQTRDAAYRAGQTTRDARGPAATEGPVDRDLQVVDEVTRPASGLAELCGWAWEAAIGPVLGRLRTRPVRLVLIPMGPLGLVPWHAAYDPARTPRRYAAQTAVISYSPSARSFRATAGYRPAPVTSALMVGNPTGDLGFAGRESRAIHDVFYPGGTYLGERGSPTDVLNWIAERPAGPAVLHLACHGAVDPRTPADAHLLLAGPARLSVRTLLDSSRKAALDVQEVFLAACTTSVGGDDHDEVLSLATSFLAAGARTVFGSLWPVPDHETSLLMFQVHRNLRGNGMTPADALHAAQLWMLDPARDTSGIPADLLRDYQPGTVFELTSWAGFIHTGR